MRRWVIVAAVLMVLMLPLAVGGCGYGALSPSASVHVVAADDLLAKQYASLWWSHLFDGHSAEQQVGSLQLAVGMDVSLIDSAAQKTAALTQLSAARQTVASLLDGGTFSQADANTVLAAFADIQTQVNGRP